MNEDWTKEFEAKCNKCEKVFIVADSSKHAEENGCKSSFYVVIYKYPAKLHYPVFMGLPMFNYE